VPTFDNHKNFALTAITHAPSPATSGTTFGVADPTALPTCPFEATVASDLALATAANAEIVRCTAFTPAQQTISVTQDSDDLNEDGSGNVTEGVGGGGIMLLTANFAQFIGLYFRNVNIPQGTVLTSALLTVTTTIGLDQIGATVYADADDDAPPGVIGAVNFNLSGRPHTTAQLTWDAVLPDAAPSTFDVTAVIQEIVNRPGWLPGNNIMLLLEDDNTGGLVALLETNATLKITVGALDLFTIERQQEGTSARAILVGDQIGAAITKKWWDDVETAINVSETVFPIPAFAPAGHIFDGQHGDDAPYVEAALAAAAAQGGGTIYWPAGCLTNIQTCISLPARGTYVFRGDYPASIYLVNDGYPPGKKASGIICTQALGAQPGGAAPASTDWIFSALNAANNGTPGSQGELTLSWRNLLIYATGGSGRPTGLCPIPGNVEQFEIRNCEFNGVGAVYLAGVAGSGQTYSGIIDSCVGQGWMVWGAIGPPFIGVIQNNTWYGLGDTKNPMPIGEIIDQQDFWTWYVHHNVFQTAGAAIASPRATIAAHGIDQTILGSIDHNAFYGGSGGHIYWKDDYSGTVNNASGGLTIDFNQFVGWNQENKLFSSLAGAAIFIDHSTAVSPDQQIIIGPNIFSGGAQTGGGAGAYYGIHIVDSPTPSADIGNPSNQQTQLNGILVSPQQLFRQVVNANLHIENGTWAGDYAFVPSRLGTIEAGNIYAAGVFSAQNGLVAGGSHFSGGSVSDLSPGSGQDLYLGYQSGNGVTHFVDPGASHEAFTVKAAATPQLGFFGHALASKPTVTGAKAGNVALANLLTALAGLGILTDSTT
jgi:hypothetical protein